MPIPLREDFDAARVRLAAKRSKDGAQARRLLTLAAIYEGASRTEAAAIGSVTVQIVRDWVVEFNEHGPAGLTQCAHHLEALDRRISRFQRLETPHRSDQLLQLAMVSLNDVVQVFDLSVRGVFRAFTLLLQLGKRRGVGRRLVRVDYFRLLLVFQSTQRFAAFVLRVGDR